jgi:hypothetical protein
MFSVTTASECAWRGLYVYVRGRQLARVTLDPNNGTKPTLTVALPIGWYRSCTGEIHPRLIAPRIPLPYIPWRWCMATGYARPVLAVYKASQRLYHNLDGRYGWGSKRRRRTAGA